MSTTVLFIEHLLTGIQTGLWITLFALSILDVEGLPLSLNDGAITIAAVIVLAIVYPLGVFVDNAADKLFGRWSRKVRARAAEAEMKEPLLPTAMQILRESNEEFLASYFGYIRTRIRICRSAALNFALLTVAGVIFTLVELANSYPSVWRLLLVEIVLGCAITSFAMWSLKSVTETFEK